MEAVNVLVVDDDVDICYTIKEICAFQKWNALTANSYPEAKRILESSRVSIILMDYHMPRTNGIKAVREIRKFCPMVPIIVLTVDESEEVFKDFMGAGANDYSIKPIRPLDLIARINAHLNYYPSYQHFNQREKGVSSYTLNRIVDSLRTNGGYMATEELQESTGVKQKTLYRYLQYMIKAGMVEQKLLYGRVGRPKLYCRLK